MAQVTTSEQYKLDIQDYLKGFAMAVYAALLAGFYQYCDNLIRTGQALALPTLNDLKIIGLVALFTGISYLYKNWKQPSQIVITKDKP